MTTFENFLRDVGNKRIAVLGMGVSNTPLIRLLAHAGARVTVCDKKNADELREAIKGLSDLQLEFRLGRSYLSDLDHRYIFRSPGIRPDIPELTRARENGAVVTSEMEVFFDVCPCTVIGVTGSDGKTTTATLIYEMLKKAGRICHLGGNIGRPLLPETAKMKTDDTVVVELSSFQLMTMRKSADVAVITNVSPNHLDWHTSMEEYVEAKKNIYLHKLGAGVLVANARNEITAKMAEGYRGELRLFARGEAQDAAVCEKDGVIFLKENGKTQRLMDAADIFLPGAHNVENYLAAIGATFGLVGADDIRSVAGSFRGVAHRIEFVREINGVKYYNDSIASSPTRTIAGLNSFDKKVILIAGGYDKHIPFDQLGEAVLSKVKTLILLGATSPKIRQAVEKAQARKASRLPVIECATMEEAVAAAAGAASPGDVVTLSPACASFDMFSNFAVRGEAFKAAVNSMRED